MAKLPASPFVSAGACPSPADSAAASSPLSSNSDAAATIPDSGVTDCPLDEAAAPLRQSDDAAVDLIAEIFVGYRKLFDPDPAAYTNADQAYYDLLLQMDDPHTADLIDMPYGMDGIFDPPPLFLQMAV